MCESCLCEAVYFKPEVYIGDYPYTYEDFGKLDVAYNKYRDTRMSVFVSAATKEYEDIKVGAILFSIENGPFLVFNEKPPKDNEGNYIPPSLYNNEDWIESNHSLSDLTYDYWVYIFEVLSDAPLFGNGITYLFKVLQEKHGIDFNSKSEVVDFIYGKIVEAATLYDQGKIHQWVDDSGM